MRPDANVADAVGRIVTERDEAAVRMMAYRTKGDIVMEMKQRGKRDGLQRAFDLLVEEGVVLP
jgi:hypothetical protein